MCADVCENVEGVLSRPGLCRMTAGILIVRRAAPVSNFGRLVLVCIKADFAKKYSFAACFEIQKVYALLHRFKIKHLVRSGRLRLLLRALVGLGGRSEPLARDLLLPRRRLGLGGR